MVMNEKKLSFILCCIISGCLAEAAKITNESRLYKELFENYNKYNHPSIESNKAVEVMFDFQLIRIIDVSAKDQYIMTYAWINQYWNNPQLTWDPDKYGGITEIHVKPTDLWTPDILLYNNVDQEDRYAGGSHTYKTNVAMRYDGNNTWLNPALFKSICKVDVTYFPFDDQECFLKYGSWSFDRSKVDLFAKRQNLLNMNYVENGEWKLTLIEAKRNEQKYQCCPHAFVDVTIHIKLQRESLDYILKLIIPCSLISSMIFLGFVLPPESGERIGLSITVLLAMTVFQQLSSELMPSYGFPLLGQYYFATMIEIGASLIVTTLILNFYHRNNRRMPRPLRILILRCLARVVFPTQKPKDWGNTDVSVEAPDNNRANPSSKNVDQGSDTDKESIYYPEPIFGKYEQTSLTEFLDPWVPMRKLSNFEDMRDTPGNGIVHQNNLNGREMKSGGGGKSIHKRITTAKKKTRQTTVEARQRRKAKPSLRKKSAVALASSALPLGLIGKASSTELSQQKAKNQKEWIKAARVLDRLFLIVSALIGIVTLFALFLKAPRFHSK